MHNIDKQAITRVLGWLDRADAQRERMRSGKGDLLKAVADLAKSDPRTTVGELVESLNFIDQSSAREPKLARMWERHINRSLRECPMLPQIKATAPMDRTVCWSSVLGARGARKNRAYHAMVAEILSLRERGLLSSLRQCGGCWKWFYADPRKRQGKRRFHSERCRGKANYNALSAEQKHRRSEYEANRRKKQRKAARLKEKQTAEEQLRYIRRMK